jgi:hypothetical protein
LIIGKDSPKGIQNLIKPHVKTIVFENTKYFNIQNKEIDGLSARPIIIDQFLS